MGDGEGGMCVILRQKWMTTGGWVGEERRDEGRDVE